MKSKDMKLNVKFDDKEKSSFEKSRRNEAYIEISSTTLFFLHVQVNELSLGFLPGEFFRAK